MFSGVDFMDISFNKIDINENDKTHILKSLVTDITDGEGSYVVDNLLTILKEI
jgi:hypothetical protein